MLEAGDQIFAGHIGELQIEKEEVSVMVREPGKCFLPAMGEGSVEPFARKASLDKGNQTLIVIDD
jgi:hypothetical protein